jgi:aryl-alcohol dehydrogenase-like predicted oxidoreductase
VAKYLDEGGQRILRAIDEIAAAHTTTVAAVALAWLLADATIAAPIASARTKEQLVDLLPSVTLRLSTAEMSRLTALQA